MSMHVNINIEETDSQGFNGKVHLIRFINYLFRTDKKQKHTNERTDYCLFSAMVGGEIVTRSFFNKEDRYELKGLGLKLALDNIDDVLTDIAYFELLDNDGEDVRFKLEFEEVIDMVDEVVAYKENKHNCLFHVAHLDQGQWHVHTVFVK